MKEGVESVIEASAAVTSISAKTSVVGGATSFAGSVFGIDPVTAFGFLIGLGGLSVSLMSFLVNWHYKRKDEKRKDELHKLEISKILKKVNNEIH